MLSSDALHDDRIVALPDSVAPLDSLALPISEGEAVAGDEEDLDSEDNDDDDDDDESDEEEEEEGATEDVWNRLYTESEARDRKAVAREMISEHRKRVSEEEELRVQVSPKGKRVSWSPPTKRERSSQSPSYENFSFSPSLSAGTEELAKGSGRKVWDFLNSKRACEKCVPPRVEEPSPPSRTVSHKSKDEMHTRLYNDAFKETPKHLVRGNKNLTFTPRISTRSERMMSNRSGSPVERLSKSSSPQRVRDQQSLVSCVTGLTVRSEPNLHAARIRVLQKGEMVSVNVNTVSSNEDGVWGNTRDGWVQITTPTGARSLIPKSGSYRNELQYILDRQGRERSRSRSRSRSPHRLSFHAFQTVHRRLSLEEELDRLREMSL